MQVVLKIKNHSGWECEITATKHLQKKAVETLKVPAFAFALKGGKKPFPWLHKAAAEKTKGGDAEGKYMTRIVRDIWQGNELFNLKGTLAFPHSASIHHHTSFQHLKHIWRGSIRWRPSPCVAIAATLWQRQQLSTWKRLGKLCTLINLAAGKEEKKHHLAVNKQRISREMG